MGLHRTYSRCESLIGYAAERRLRILNTVNSRTHIRWQGKWVVDISRVSTWTARLVEDWRLTEDAETLTDNQYLLLHLCLPRRGTSHGRRFRALPLVRSEKVGYHAYIKKWVLKKMDKDMLIAAAHIATWLITPSDLNAIEV